MNSIGKICVFCGSSTGTGPEYLEKARLLGESLAKNGITLVFGGSNIGLMGALAKSVMDNGGYAIGVIPKRIYEMVTRIEAELQLNVPDKEHHMPLSEEHIVGDMHERKSMMYRLADAFIVLPGGIGTMEEFFEAFTWNQLGYHLKPIGILEINGFYDHLKNFLNHMVKEGFCKREQMDTLVMDEEPDRLIRRLREKEMQYIEKIK